MNEAAGPTAIRLLILSTSRDRTEQISTSLRNGGLAVHSTRLGHMDMLEGALERAESDLLLCCAFEAGIDLQQTIDTLNEHDRDIPLLVITDAEADPQRLIQAMREGARDLIDKDDPEHLQLVVAREFSDLNQRRELAALKQRLAESDRRCLGLIESSREPIAFIQDGMHVHVNPAYLKLFGFTDRSEVEDLPLLDILDKAYHKNFRRTLKALESGGENSSTSIQAEYRRQDDSSIQATMTLSRASIDGEPSLQVIIRSNTQDTQEMERKLRHMADLDSATDLPNRHYFLNQLDHWVNAAREDNELRALAYISIDHFPRLHSALGMTRCDTLVRDIAGLLHAEISEQDLLARFSDNAFTLLCRRPDATRIETLMRKLRDKIDSAYCPDIQSSLGPACSIGVTFLGDMNADGQDFINEAYNTADSARERGGNQVLVNYPKDETSEIEAQNQLVLQQIDEAFSRDRFRLVYQPIVSLQGDTRENYAVLVRMLNKEGEEQLPETFIHHAERFGKMVEIDRWVVRQAISSLSMQRKEGRKANFFISLSEAALTDANMLLWICDCLREFDARGGWLTFQIREKHARENLQAAVKLIDGLKKIKCLIAIDHFGLLPKPELLLKKLKADFAKLAPSFVREISSDQQKQDELNSLNELILSLGIKTIATGVEDANSLTVLWTVGVGYIQGYFLQEPAENIEYGVQQLV